MRLGGRTRTPLPCRVWLAVKLTLSRTLYGQRLRYITRWLCCAIVPGGNEP